MSRKVWILFVTHYHKYCRRPLNPPRRERKGKENNIVWMLLVPYFDSTARSFKHVAQRKEGKGKGKECKKELEFNHCHIVTSPTRRAEE